MIKTKLANSACNALLSRRYDGTISSGKERLLMPVDKSVNRFARVILKCLVVQISKYRSLIYERTSQYALSEGQGPCLLPFL